MAVKNASVKVYPVSVEDLRRVLQDPDFCHCMDVDYVEEAVLADASEFRYIKKTNRHQYGRNYFIRVKKIADSETEVSITTQSRKVTVLWDIGWDQKVERAFSFIDLLLRR